MVASFSHGVSAAPVSDVTPQMAYEGSVPAEGEMTP